MAVIGEASIAVKGDTKGFSNDVTKGVESGMKSALAKVGALLAVAGIGAKVGEFLKGTIAEGREANRVGAQAAQVIKTTGGVAGVTAAMVDDLADSLARKTGIDDEAIKSSEALLLSFTNVQNRAGEGNDIYSRTIPLLADLSAAMGKDLHGATIALGKALNDPVKGIASLSRVGVQFTDDQKAMIKAMVEGGNVAGAQGLILDQLAVKFGGQAEAQATAADKLRVGWQMFQEEIGKRLIPAIDFLEGKLADKLPAATDITMRAIDGAVRIVQGLKPEFEALGSVVGPLKEIIGGALRVIGEVIRDTLNPALSDLNPLLDKVNGGLPETTNAFGEFLSKLAGKENTINVVAAAIAGLATSFALIKGAAAVGSVASGLSSLFGGIGSALGPLLANPVGIAVVAIVAIGTAGFIAYQKIKPFRDLVDDVARFFKGVFFDAVEIGRNVIEGIGRAVERVVTVVGPTLSTVAGAISGAFGTVVETVGPIFEKVATIVGGAFSTVVDTIGTVVANIGPIFEKIGQVIGGAFTKVQDFIQPFLDWWSANVSPTIGAGVEFLQALFARLGQAAEIVGRILSEAFGALVDVLAPILRTIGRLIGNLADFMGTILGPAFRFIKTVVVEVFGTLVDIIEPVVRIIGTIFATGFRILTVIVGTVFNGIKTIIEGALRILRGIFEVFTGILTLNWDKLWQGIKDIIGGVWHIISGLAEQGVKMVKDVLIKAWEGLLTIVETAWDGVFEFFRNLPGRLLSILGDLGGLLWAGIQAGFDLFISNIGDIWSGIVDTAGQLPGLLVGALGNLGGLLWDGIKASFAIAWDFFGTIVDKVTALPGQILGLLANLGGLLWDGIKASFGAAWDVLSALGDIFTSLPGKILGQIGNLGSWLWDNFKAGFDTLKSSLGGVLDAVVDYFVKLPGRFLSGAGNIGSWLWDNFKEGFNTLSTSIGGIIDGIVGFFTGLPGRLLALVETVGGAAASIGKAILDGIGNGISGAIGFVADIASKLKDAVVGVVNTWVIDKINAGIRGVFEVLDNVIPDFVWDVNAKDAPQIPRLAAGAIVKARPGGTAGIIAEAGRDEAVIPLDRGLLAGLRAIAQGVTQQAPTLVDASVNIGGSVYGVNDLDAYLDQRDQRLADLLMARGR